MRQRRKAGDRDITRDANVIYRAAFNGESLPTGWRVIYCETRGRKYGGTIGLYGFSGALGRCCWSTKTILMHRRAWNLAGCHSEKCVPGGGWLAILIHEFIHQRCRALKHGEEFNRLTKAAYDRVWG